LGTPLISRSFVVEIVRFVGEVEVHCVADDIIEVQPVLVWILNVSWPRILELRAALLVAFQDAVRDHPKQLGPGLLRRSGELLATDFRLPDVGHRRSERVHVLDLKPGDRGVVTTQLDEVRHNDEVDGIEVVDAGTSWVLTDEYVVPESKALEFSDDNKETKSTRDDHL